MTWVKLDDTFYDNGTNRRLGPAGRDLFMAGLTFCAKGLTDGRIPKADVPLVLASAQAKAALVQRLVDAGRWIDRGDHYEVDGYLLHNPSRAKVVEARERERVKKAKQRQVGAVTSDRHETNGRYVPPGTTPGDTPQGQPGGVPEGRPPLPVPSRPPTNGCTTAQADTPAARQQRIDETARQIATARAATRPDVGPGWITACARGIARDHHQQLHAHLTAHPEANTDELAALIEQATAPQPRLVLPPTSAPEHIADLEHHDGPAIPTDLRDQGLATVRALRTRGPDPDPAA